MTTVELRFPAGRFHATPWGRHVNEGAVEWPVEPWRLLRALVATWFHKARADVEEATLVRVVTTLAETLPVYRLPAASLGHTRHYMPFNEGKNEKTTKIFDAFVHIAEDEPVGVAWDVDLPVAERAALAVLLERLGYLGRAESLVEAALLDAAEGPYETRPLPPGRSADDGEELVSVLAPMSGADYAGWRQDYLQRLPAAKGKGKSPKGAAADPAVPADIFQSLLADTGALKAAGWNLPPGARRVTYVRPADAFKIRPLASRQRHEKATPTVARFALASAVLPSITAAVSVGDRVHKTLVALSGNHRVFTGHEEDGRPCKGHQHAYILPESDPEGDRIRFLTVYAAEGFDDQAKRALSNLRAVWGHGGHDIQLVLLGFGRPENFGGPAAEAGQSLILHASQEWVSLTPFVPTRHGKFGSGRAPKLDADRLQIGGPEHDFRRLLQLRLPDVEILSVEAQKTSPARGLRWLQFQRSRQNGNGLRAGEFGYGFRVRFEKKVPGPIAVGYGAHFGLGLLCATGH